MRVAKQLKRSLKKKRIKIGDSVQNKKKEVKLTKFMHLCLGKWQKYLTSWTHHTSGNSAYLICKQFSWLFLWLKYCRFFQISFSSFRNTMTTSCGILYFIWVILQELSLEQLLLVYCHTVMNMYPKSTVLRQLAMSSCSILK